MGGSVKSAYLVLGFLPVLVAYLAPTQYNWRPSSLRSFVFEKLASWAEAAPPRPTAKLAEEPAARSTNQGHRPYVLTMLRRRAALRPLVNPSQPGIHKRTLARLLLVVTPRAKLTLTLPPCTSRLGPEKSHKSRELST